MSIVCLCCPFKGELKQKSTNAILHREDCMPGHGFDLALKRLLGVFHNAWNELIHSVVFTCQPPQPPFHSDTYLASFNNAVQRLVCSKPLKPIQSRQTNLS